MNFFCRLNAPRPTFAQDITEAEMAAMQEHVGYWRDALSLGHVIAFGMVADPKGPFGVGLVEFESEEAARDFTDNDPTIRSGLGFSFDVLPMPRGVVHS